MANQDISLNNASPASTDSNGSTKPKRTPRKSLPNAVQSNAVRGQRDITIKIASTPKSVAASDFPLFKPFLMSPESDELFIKTTKHTVVSLSTGDRFASNITGYLVIL